MSEPRASDEHIARIVAASLATALPMALREVITELRKAPDLKPGGDIAPLLALRDMARRNAASRADYWVCGTAHLADSASVGRNVVGDGGGELVSPDGVKVMLHVQERADGERITEAVCASQPLAARCRAVFDREHVGEIRDSHRSPDALAHMRSRRARWVSQAAALRIRIPFVRATVSKRVSEIAHLVKIEDGRLTPEEAAMAIVELSKLEPESVVSQ